MDEGRCKWERPERQLRAEQEGKPDDDRVNQIAYPISSYRLGEYKETIRSVKN